jgi:hypothetical protein
LKNNSYNKTQALDSKFNPKIIQKRNNDYSETNNERKDIMNGT